MSEYVPNSRLSSMIVSEVSAVLPYRSVAILHVSGGQKKRFVMAQLEESLQHLRTDHLDLRQFTRSSTKTTRTCTSPRGV